MPADTPRPDGFPTRLSASDRRLIEEQTQRLGRELLAASLAARPSRLSPDAWMQQANEWVTQDEELKVRLFRLVDCMPMLDDPAALDRHVREYLSEEVVDGLPGTLRMALKAARSGILAPLAARAVRAATLAQARRFIAGGNPDEAARAALGERRAHRGFTLDLLGEAVTSDADADAYAAAYERLLRELPAAAARWPADPRVDEGPDGPMPRVNVSLKLSALDSQFDAIDPEGTRARVLERLRPLLRLARAQGAQVHVDMESHATKDLSLDIFRTVAAEDEFRDWRDFGIVIQAYLRDATADLPALAAWARERGTPVWVRLVKGAYWDYESIHARAAGWPVPVWERKHDTDACYEAATTFLLEHADVLRPALGSHNLRSLAHGMAVAGHLGLPRRLLEVQMLYGMGDAEKQAVTEAGWRLRVYMPYGELVPGMAYLVRRLLENSSNESFLRAGFVKALPEEVLLRPPADSAAAEGAVPRSGGAAAAGDGFRNEPLADFSRADARAAMAAALGAFAAGLARGSAPIVPVVIDGRPSGPWPLEDRADPSDTARVVARVSMPPAAEAARAVEAAARGLPAWRDAGTPARAEALRRAAGILRRRRHELAATIVHEVGKSWREADGDVAEAIDFCEYYAAEALRLDAPRRHDVPGEENVTLLRPRGVCAVIAPWNFPLAILAGMTTAALVTGNTVVMKPAEQSSLTGLRLHEILLEAGVPPTAVQFLPGRGEEVGPALVTHPETAIVAFTGSRAVGLAINRAAAEAVERGSTRMITRIIAELGGKNAIIVDDDADLDEAVVGVVHSAFGFQGQKCSACSRAIVLERVHDAFVRKLAPAVRSLRIGPASDPGARVGPLVDREARDRVRSRIAAAAASAREVVAVEAGAWAERGWYVGPAVFTDVDPRSSLAQDEIFGPVLAVIRARTFDDAIAIANATPYALTAGVYSRSPGNLERARQGIEAGNLYLNRGITGALVARQPFGGYRMSGVGSKAGGPDYLLQFTVPRTVTENTMRRGFAPTQPADDGPRRQSP